MQRMAARNGRCRRHAPGAGRAFGRRQAAGTTLSVRQGIPRRVPAPEVPVAQWRECYDSGASLAEVGRKFGVSEGVIRLGRW